MTNSITIVRPDDWHLHLRDGDAMSSVVRDSAERFGRAIIMPNLSPPVTTVTAALQYRDRILAQIPDHMAFEPLMTLYLTDNTDPGEIRSAVDSGQITAAKLYPAGATTNSDSGVTDISNIMGVLEMMAEVNLPLLVHGEVTNPEIDIFDREAIFIEQTLAPLAERLPSLRIVLEHITTISGVQFVQESSENIAATITAHHLLMNRNAIFSGGINPHHYCLPVLKREQHRVALVEAATSGNRKFFSGTDSAPHSRSAKESSCGCAGMYTAHAAVELYAEAFDQAGALDKLEGFASFHGADFYNLPRNREKITLERKEWIVPSELPFGDDTLIPLRANDKVLWSILPQH
ncbi:MAG: dihydroorotase [Gammaproteobacteria bacterium]|uniref:Dihydroorotase n=1 Tax=Candidatus Thiopontia autotrophica TaxID=2841688 RepID=A0A8J6P3B4_9GAMM|nr:dihydroorotase [Candidatus Thiopontia autotrophica]